jgi:hypothetical protein
MVKKAKAVVPPKASIDTMLHATMRANQNKAVAYGGNGFLGDSIERRFNSSDPASLSSPSAYEGSGGYGYQGGYGGYGGGSVYGPYGRPGGVYGSGFKYLRRFAGNASFIHQIIGSCILCYLSEGIVRRVLDLYADFVCENFVVSHPDKSVRNFYTAWAKKIKLKLRLRTFFLTLFTTGNVFIYRHWASLKPEDIKALKRLEAKLVGEHLYVEDEKEDREVTPTQSKTAKWLDHFIAAQKAVAIQGEDTPEMQESEAPENDQMIPWGYTALNPLQMELRGKRFKGESYWIIALDRTELKDLASQYGLTENAADIGFTRINLPSEMKSKLQKYEGIGGGYMAEIKLDKRDLSVVQDYKFDWFDWAIPFVYPAITPLYFKQCLRKMEARACESVINSIFLFKLGNLEKGMPAEDEHFERLADMLQQPGQVQNIIWNEAIEAEVVQPDINQIFDAKKHVSADKDIMMALGIPEVMLGGAGGSYSNSFVALQTVLERLESARDLFEVWMLGEMEIIAKVMKFRRMPTIKWDNSSLKDENAIRTLYLNLFDRGILSRDSLLREFDTDFDTELGKQEEETEDVPLNKDSNEKVMKKLGPYIKDQPPAPLAPGGGAAPKTPNGRPGGSKEAVPRGKQTAPRGPVGQSKAILEDYDDLLSVGKDMLDSLEERVAAKLLKTKGLKYVKQLEASDRERLEGLIQNMFSHLPADKPKEFDTEDYLVHLLESDGNARVKANVLALYAAKIAKYEEKYGKPPSREHRRQFIISSWTQAAISERTNKIFRDDD